MKPNRILPGLALSWTLIASAAFAGVTPPTILAPDERLITILATNDIHGGVEPSQSRNGGVLGGMAIWSAIARSIRLGIQQHFGPRAGVLTVDAGDQFQGTLLSNFNEGQLVFASMAAIGYDAVIPGNHDFDFGPTGWLDDQVNPGNPDKNPRGALERLIQQTQRSFPLISANAFMKASLVDAGGTPVQVSGPFCRPVNPAQQINWSNARTYLRPYVIKTVADGVRVALIALDNAETPLTTTAPNVADLCFDDEASAYRRIRASLQGKADVFVIITHDGNTNNSDSVSALVRNLKSTPQFTLDAVVAGHTHYVNSLQVAGVPIIQSGSGGQMFGRIDLIYNKRLGSVVPQKMRFNGGIPMFQDHCGAVAAPFCDANPATKELAYEGIPLVPNPAVLAMIAKAKAEVAPMAFRHLGVSDGVIPVDRIRESPLADAMTDLLREVSGADVVFMNTGGIRTAIGPGEFNYEMLFKVFPFNNHTLLQGPMPAPLLIEILAHSIQSCGAYGALMQSGLRVIFERNCEQAVNQIDQKARLLSVSTSSGEVLYDAVSNHQPDPARVLKTATLDFLAAGGAGYSAFQRVPVLGDLGILRETFATHLLEKPIRLTPSMDGRLKEVARP